MTPELILAKLLVFRYPALFVLAIVEGPILMVLCGFFVKLGYLPFLASYFVLMAGDFVADIGWYAVGYYGARPLMRRYGHLVSFTEAAEKKIEALFHRYDTAILFVSKITMGFGFALVTLITAGMMRISFKKYVVFNAIGGFIWTALLLAVGYSFGNLYYLIDKGFRVASAIAFIAIVAAALYGANRALRRKVLETNV
jgi:membrane-associated protein